MLSQICSTARQANRALPALVNDPLFLDVLREMGVVQLCAGQYEEAVSTFQRVRGSILNPGQRLARAYSDPSARVTRHTLVAEVRDAHQP